MTLAALTWLMGDKVATTSHRQAEGWQRRSEEGREGVLGHTNALRI